MDFASWNQFYGIIVPLIIITAIIGGIYHFRVTRLIMSNRKKYYHYLWEWYKSYKFLTIIPTLFILVPFLIQRTRISWIILLVSVILIIITAIIIVNSNSKIILQYPSFRVYKEKYGSYPRLFLSMELISIALIYLLVLSLWFLSI